MRSRLAAMRAAMILAVLGLAISACGSNGSADAEQRYPDVVGVAVDRNADLTLRFDVIVSSPYDGPDRYADAWRVVGSDGTVFGVRELLHDHAGEQPFTRSLDGVEIPDGIDVVTVEARDLVNGWGGAVVEAAIPSAADRVG